MVMYAKEVNKKEEEKLPEKQQHHVLFSYYYSLPLSFLFFILFFTEKDNAQS